MNFQEPSSLSPPFCQIGQLAEGIRSIASMPEPIAQTLLKTEVGGGERGRVWRHQWLTGGGTGVGGKQFIDCTAFILKSLFFRFSVFCFFCFFFPYFAFLVLVLVLVFFFFYYYFSLFYLNLVWIRGREFRGG